MWLPSLMSYLWVDEGRDDSFNSVGEGCSLLKLLLTV